MKAEIIKVEGKYIILFEEDGKLVDAVEVDSIRGEYGDTVSEP